MITDTGKILTVLKAVLSGACYTAFKYYITAFECELFNDRIGISAYLVFSEIELADKIEWNKWVHSFPFNIENYNGPEEPARVFLMGLLTQAQIRSVEQEYKGTLLLVFQNGLKVRLIGKVEIEDIAWAIEFRNTDSKPIGDCTCSFNKLFLNISEELMHKLDAASH